jgi:CHAD domain-containing protein
VGRLALIVGDVEHVHQLRVATRRAVESVRLFSTMIPDEVGGNFRATLRRIRLAADQARNWDVPRHMLDKRGRPGVVPQGEST